MLFDNHYRWFTYMFLFLFFLLHGAFLQATLHARFTGIPEFCEPLLAIVVHTAGHLCSAACLMQKHHIQDFHLTGKSSGFFENSVQAFVRVLICFCSVHEFNTLQAQSSSLDLSTMLASLHCSNLVIGPLGLPKETFLGYFQLPMSCVDQIQPFPENFLNSPPTTSIHGLC